MTEPARQAVAATSKTRHPLLVLLAAVVALAVTARLGVWQLDRAAQKTAMQAEIDERARLPELRETELAVDAALAPAQFGRLARLRGRWLTDKTVYLDNRVMMDRVGFFVVTPLVLASGSSVLVQRGWVPRDAAQRTHLPDIRTPDTSVEISGRLAPALSQLYQLGAAGTGLIRQNVEVVAFARETGLALRPLVLLQLAVAGDAADGLAREWPRPAVDVYKNYGYAFQWFALSALITGLYIWLQLVRPRLKRAQTDLPTEPQSGH